MRRSLGVALGLFLLAGCGEAPEPTPLEPSPPEELTQPPSADISDANNGGNQHFFWLPPVVWRPQYSGVAVTDISPEVEICLLDRGTMACDPGTALLARFVMDSGPVFDRVYPGYDGNFWVTWRRAVFTPQEGNSYRVSVVVEGSVLGYFDVEIQAGRRWWNLGRNDGFIQIADSGPFLFGFRVEEGALEQAFCDAVGQGLEDCDVEQINDQNGGVLRVFENPGGSGETPAAVVVIPPNAARLEGEPISDYVVIAELEDQGTTQGGSVPQGDQIPYFIDLRTEPAGISFDTESEGVSITLCQDQGFLEEIPEPLHPLLRPFIVYSDGTTVLPGEFVVGVEACEGYELASSGHGHPEGGFFGRLAAGSSRIARFLRPSNLYARRLHGGLNTVIYNTRGNDRPGGGDAAPAFQAGMEDFVVELGAVLDVDPFTSVASIGNGESGLPTEILVEARNGLGAPFPFGGDLVEVAVSGANPQTLTAQDNGDGTYTASYTPLAGGEDILTVTINGYEISGSPYLSQVTGFGTVSVEATVDGSPASGLQIVLYGGSAQVASAPTDESGRVAFEGLAYGAYLVQAAGGYDFDVRFPQANRPVTLASAVEGVVFSGMAVALPANVRVWRLSEGGNGNAFEYVRGALAWGAANSAAQQRVILGAGGHLATIASGGENSFVNNLRFVGLPVPSGAQASTEPLPADDMRAWLGLTDQAQEGVFLWVTGEPLDYANWDSGEPNNGGVTGQPNEEYVEMFASGFWNDIAAGTSANQGYVVEWEVVRPPPPPF